MAVARGDRFAVAKLPRDFALGCRVSHNGNKGYLRFYGRTNFAAGIWAGVELDHPLGVCNGRVDMVEYFVCRDLHGVFVKLSALQRLRHGAYKKSGFASAAPVRYKQIVNFGISAKLAGGIGEFKRKRHSDRQSEALRTREYTAALRYYDIPELGAGASPAELLAVNSQGYGARGSSAKQGADDYSYYSDENDSSDSSATCPIPTLPREARARGLRLAEASGVWDPTLQPCGLTRGERVLTAMDRVGVRAGGVVRWVGYIEGRRGLWVGIELDAPLVDAPAMRTYIGPHDGSLAGAYYFSCPPSLGLFVRPSALVRVSRDEAARLKVRADAAPKRPLVLPSRPSSSMSTPQTGAGARANVFSGHEVF